MRPLGSLHGMGGDFSLPGKNGLQSFIRVGLAVGQGPFPALDREKLAESRSPRVSDSSPRMRSKCDRASIHTSPRSRHCPRSGLSRQTLRGFHGRAAL
jgi:hypothetical protein